MSRALVTGGTRGIGAAIAEALVADGHDVIVTGTSRRRGGPVRCTYAACDFTRPKALASFAKEMAGAGVTVLVNNAGVNEIGPVETYSLAQFARLQQVNLTAPFLLCRAVLPGMRRRRFGRIVNITSIFSVVSKAGRAAYSAGKAGLAGFTRALALETASGNILVNCVAPGFVDTELTRRVLGRRGMTRIRAQIPIRRLARPQEIARVVRFLVSKENSYLTGQNIIIDGGYTSQ